MMSDAPRLHVVPDPSELAAVLTRASSVVPVPVQWLAHGYLAEGKLTVLDGDPGLGKSTLAIDWAAKVSRGLPLFDGGASSRPRGVVLISDEDDRADTIRPRLEAAGADLERVGLLHFERVDGEELLPEFPRDGDALSAIVDAIDAALVIIDPLMLYLGAEINANRDSEIRRALGPIIRAAQRCRAAVLVLRHHTKGGGTNALYRGGGSIGIVGAARIGLMVARDTKTDPDGRTCVLACFKNNLAPFPPAMAYELESAPGTQVARIRWLGITQRTADSLLDTEERSAREEAADFLRATLARGPQPVKLIQREARDAGIASRTLERAKADLGVRAVQTSGGWEWNLPTPRPPNGDSGRQAGRQEIPRNLAEIRSGRQAAKSANTIYECVDCGLPRGRDTRPCPNCGGTEGKEHER